MKDKYHEEFKVEVVNDSNIQHLYNNYPRVANWFLLRGDFYMDESYKFDEFSEWGEIK